MERGERFGGCNRLFSSLEGRTRNRPIYIIVGKFHSLFLLFTEFSRWAEAVARFYRSAADGGSPFLKAPHTVNNMNSLVCRVWVSRVEVLAVS